MICASSKYPRNERIKQLFKSIEDWINSDQLNQLITLFGGKIVANDFGDRIEEVNKFVDVWDFRKILAEKQIINERWNISDDEFVKANEEFIFQKAIELGLVNTHSVQFKPTHILPLGGARFSNLHRVELSKQIIDQNDLCSSTKVVALSGMRVINEKERSAIDTYAPYAKTEFDAINAGLESVFLLGSLFHDECSKHKNQNLNSCIREYTNTYRGINVSSVAAPSQSPDRRANSRDTFEYFCSKYNIGAGSSLLLVTSQIYVPYQLLKFVDLAIEGGFDVECVGTQMNTTASISKASNYLQEIKGTINAIYSLFLKYSKEIN